MTSLLNRFAWIISFLIGITVFILFMGGGSYYSFFYEGLGILFWGAIIGIIFKNVFFSSSGIEEAVMSIARDSQKSTISPVGSHAAKDPIPNIAFAPTNSSVVTSIIESFQEPDTHTHENVVMEKTYIPPTPVPPVSVEPSALSKWIENFFSDRPLAKIGGILLFLGALFFLGLIFVAIGPKGRVLMGIAFGFFLIGVGVWLDKKEIRTEARVLFGIGIAVNYLTILFGRNLLTGNDAIMSDGLATLVLLLNTALAIVLALVYRSRVLLGFAFIFAYATPFLVGSQTSNVILIVIYTTILTIGISIINLYYSRMDESENIEYLEWIAVVGMTILFSVAGFGNENAPLAVGIGLGISVLSLSAISYQQRRSPIAIFIAAYIVLVTLSIEGTSLVLLPFCIISLLLLSVFFILQNLITIISLLCFGAVSFIIGLVAFWSGGSIGIDILFLTGVSVFAILGFASLKMASNLLASVAVLGFGILTFLGISTTNIPMESIGSTMILVKCMSIILLIGASIFTLRLRGASVFFLAVLMSGILMVYPNTFATHMGITVIAFMVYICVALTMPYLLTRSDYPILNKVFLLASLPLSALVVSYGIYELGQEKFPGIGMGVAYILQAILYLAYAVIAGSKFFVKDSKGISGNIGQDNKNILIVLFALPLSLFTFSLAFLFQDTPGVMSLAWILESVILYLIALRMNDTRIFMGATLVFVIGIIKQVSLIHSLTPGNYTMFAILILMLVGVLSSLIIIRQEKREIRIFYDIIHIISIISIGYGISRIIPSTGHGWSIFGPALLILALTSIYTKFGNKIHQIFVSFLFGILCLSFIGTFSSLHHEVPYLFVQMGALLCIVIIGYMGYYAKTLWGCVNMGIATIGFLWVSSLYIDDFAGIFAVSIYLTIVTSILIIRGIMFDSPRIRTIGLYIGIFVLAKILFYDIWSGNSDTITRVVALMIAGGLMIYLSQLYGKYVSRGWSMELAFSNIVGDVFVSRDTPVSSVTETDIGSNDASVMETDTGSNNPSVMETNTGSNNETNPFSGELDIELKNIRVSEFLAVSFITTSGEVFTVKRVSVIRLAKYITDTLKRREFAPNQLVESYDFVIKNMSSTLPKAELEPLLEKLKKWIGEGGSVEFVLKNK